MAIDWGQLWRRGRETWPEVDLAEERFTAMARAADLESADGAASGDSIDAGELYLACAFAEGVPAAGQIVARDYLPALQRRLATMGVAPADIDEVVQRACERLIAADPEGGPRLIKYAGQGRLRSLLVVVGAHIAVDSFRRTGREKTDHEALLELAAASDPRAELMRRQGQAVFKSAVEAALAALAPRERTVLRLHLIDRLTLDEIADYYQVHRVTVSRWLAAARLAVVERAREVARAEFGVSETEFDAAYTGSHLGLSLERLLAE